MKRVLVFASASIALLCTAAGVELQNIEANARMLLAAARENAASGTTNLFPRTFVEGKVVFVDREDRCAGFFAGELWLLYELTGKDEWLAAAREWTEPLEPARNLSRTHDVGFILQTSFGNGLRLAGVDGYFDVLKDGAKALASRYSPRHGLIKSWDKWDTSPYTFPVIVDNMMNLELLCMAGALPTAVAHAKSVDRRHFRADGSVYHVLDYAADEPDIRGIYAGQGKSVDGAWARGQGWAVYGFTMMYRYSHDGVFLSRAVGMADWWLAHNRASDGVPPWDFADPFGPRDASAAAVVAAGLAELDHYSPNRGYRAEAERIVSTLASDAYLAKEGECGGFLLKHSTGNAPAGHEIDVPLIYADYYYLETLARLAK
ncbi:MAG: glycoside hydrolase family 88 protein [Kiritimatiellae bacterium]|nr:glycoside hydrolase family 88 protein [Kiritimatiellia bacterium]